MAQGTCHHCGYSGDQHAPMCPKTFTEEPLASEMMDIWHRGWFRGRTGYPLPPGACLTFQHGWSRGEVAMEEAENGDDGR